MNGQKSTPDFLISLSQETETKRQKNTDRILSLSRETVLALNGLIIISVHAAYPYKYVFYMCVCVCTSVKCTYIYTFMYCKNFSICCEQFFKSGTDLSPQPPPCQT